jgi:hypothetical protein
MDAFDALKRADDVKTFPSISMPLPVFKVHTGKTPSGKTKESLGVSCLSVLYLFAYHKLYL